jgi:hypothetical protein
MPSIINASTSSGLIQTADTSGVLELQSNGSTKLTVNASGVTIPTLTATTVIGAITQGTAVASTSGTSVDFTGIPSWAKQITVMFNGVSTSSTSNYLVQVGSTTFQTTGYSSRALRDGSSAATSTAGFILTGSIAAGSLNGGLTTITNISGNLWVFTSILADATGGNNSYAGGYMTSALSGVLDRVRITTVNGTDTFDAGSINILYEG